MTLDRVCLSNGRRSAWTVREVREGQGVIFYDATRNSAGDLEFARFGERAYSKVVRRG